MEYHSMRHMEHVTFKPVEQLINKGINLNIVNKVNNN